MKETLITSLVDGLPLKTHYQTYTARDGVKLSFQRFGQGTPLILIHGLGSSSIDWELQMQTLGEHFDLIMPDIRGFGQSTQAYFDMQHPSASINLFATDVVDLMLHLGIDGCPVLGYSMGGAVAFQLAVDDLNNSEQDFHPTQLIIVNSLPTFEIDSFRKRYMIGLRRLFTRFLSMATLAKMIGSKLFPDNPTLAAQMTARNGRNKKPPYKAAFNALIAWKVGPQLKDLTQDTLFITADQDYSLVTDKEKAAEGMQNASVTVINDSMHGTPFDQPEKFNQAILDFLLK